MRLLRAVGLNPPGQLSAKIYDSSALVISTGVPLGIGETPALTTSLPDDYGATSTTTRIEVWVRGRRRLGLKLGIDPLRGVPVVIALPEVDGEVELASPGLIEVGDQLLLVGGRVFESLERIDANHDGRLSRSEVRAAMRRMGMEINAALPDVLAAKLSTLGLAKMPARAAGAATVVTADAAVASAAGSLDCGDRVVSIDEFKAAMQDAVVADIVAAIGREKRPLKLVFLRSSSDNGSDDDVVYDVSAARPVASGGEDRCINEGDMVVEHAGASMVSLARAAVRTGAGGEPS